MALVIIMIIQTVESVFLLPVEAPEDEVILNVIEDPEKYSAVVDFYAELD